MFLSKKIILTLLSSLISASALAQESDFDSSVPEPVQPIVDFQFPIEPPIPPDPKFSSDASVVDYIGVPSSINLIPSQVSFSVPDFSATMAALSAPLLNLTGGINVDAISSGLGPLASVAGSSYLNATTLNLNTIATTSLLNTADPANFNDGALEEQAVMNIMAALKSGTISSSPAFNNTRTLLANMRFGGIATDGFNFYTADGGTLLGSVGDINVAGAEAYLGGTISDSGFCATPIGLCALFAAIKAQIKTRADLDKLRQGGRDPFDLLGAQNEPSFADRFLLQLRTWIDSFSFDNPLSPTTTPVPATNTPTPTAPTTVANALQTGTTTFKNVGSLTGLTFDQANSVLQQNGFEYRNKVDGYDYWVNSNNGSSVAVGANGQVIKASPSFTADGKTFNLQYDISGKPFISDSAIGQYTGELLRDSQHYDNMAKQNNGPIPGVTLVNPGEPNAVATLNSNPNLGLQSKPTVTATPNPGPATGTTMHTPSGVPIYATTALSGFCFDCTPPSFNESLILAEYGKPTYSLTDADSKMEVLIFEGGRGTKNVYIVSPDNRTGAYGQIDKDGFAAVNLDLHQFKGTPYAITGIEAGDLLLAAARQSKIPVEGIRIELKDSQGMTTNLNVFNRYMKRGDSEVDALAKTPSGMAARELGFTEVQIAFSFKATATSPAVYSKGDYTKVIGIFTKPPGK